MYFEQGEGRKVPGTFRCYAHSPSSSFPHADLYSELDDELDVSDNCSSSSSSPLKESTFSKLAVQVCLCVTAVSGSMVVRGSVESVAPVSGAALLWVEPEARYQARGCFFIFTSQWRL